MDNFPLAFTKLKELEGVYSNDPDDPGGETFRGIARKYHPNWKGWKLVDSYKASRNYFDAEDFEECAGASLEKLVISFYKENFWDVFNLDKLPDASTHLIFQFAVNVGVSRMSIFLQEVVNVLNRNEQLYNDIVEDGIFGEKSSQALDLCIKKNGQQLFVTVLRSRVQQHYWDLMRRYKKNEKFIGWFKR